jgi:phage shock protein A
MSLQQEQLDSVEKVSKRLDEHDQKFSNQYEATDALLKRVAALERKLSNLEKQCAA